MFEEYVAYFVISHERQGMKTEAAVCYAVDHFKLGERTVRRYLSKWRGQVEYESF